MAETSLWREDFPKDTNPFHFFLFCSRPYWKPATLAIIAVVVAGSFSASIAYVFKLIANAAAGLSKGGSYHDLIFACAMYVLFLLAAKVAWRISGFLGMRWATGARATARQTLTSYVTLHSRAYFSDRFAGSIATKISHAGNGMTETVEKILWDFLELVVASVVSLIIAFFVSTTVAWTLLVWLLTVVIINVYFARKRRPLAMRSQALETKLTGMTVDLLSNITTMQEYARREFEMNNFKDAILERRVSGLENWGFSEWVLVLNNILQFVFGSAMLFFAVTLMQKGLISLGDIILVITIIFRIEGHLHSLGNNINRMSNTWGEIEESLEEIVEPHEIPDSASAQVCSISSGEIRLADVSFNYGDISVFQKLNLFIPAGQRVGIVGRSGAGKSTLMRILLRHHELHGGQVLIDGTDIAQVTQESLRCGISVVPQEPLLFHRSIGSNIAYGKPDASEEEIVEAAARAQADHFIKRLPEGYESLVGERGVKLSGGERQRIAIARAILKNAPILLMDEATASLDSESEVAIQAALHVLMEGKTVIAIAHRLSTLRQMDRILVLDHGEIVEDGTHEELLKKKGIYSELWNHQAGGFLQDE